MSLLPLLVSIAALLMSWHSAKSAKRSAKIAKQAVDIRVAELQLRWAEVLVRIGTEHSPWVVKMMPSELRDHPERWETVLQAAGVSDSDLVSIRDDVKRILVEMDAAQRR